MSEKQRPRELAWNHEGEQRGFDRYTAPLPGATALYLYIPAHGQKAPCELKHVRTRHGVWESTIQSFEFWFAGLEKRELEPSDVQAIQATAIRLMEAHTRKKFLEAEALLTQVGIIRDSVPGQQPGWYTPYGQDRDSLFLLNGSRRAKLFRLEDGWALNAETASGDVESITTGDLLTPEQAVQWANERLEETA